MVVSIKDYLAYECTIIDNWFVMKWEQEIAVKILKYSLVVKLTIHCWW